LDAGEVQRSRTGEKRLLFEENLRNRVGGEKKKKLSRGVQGGQSRRSVLGRLKKYKKGKSVSVSKSKNRKGPSGG